MTDTIDATQCAELLRCTVGQVMELARTGEIPGIKPGREWVFVRSDLLTYLAERARSEAQERRAKRAPAANDLPKIKPRRQTPPVLPFRAQA